MKKHESNLAYIEGILSLIINVLLFGLKYWAGVVTGSVAIIADAWHTLSDSLTSIVVIIATFISRKPADKEHPFGHGRSELIASLIIGMFLAIVGVNFIIESVDKLRSHESATFNTLAITIIAISIVLKEAIAQFAFWAGRKTGSRSLHADGWHHRSDAISSVIILVGLFLGRHFWWIDGVLGILVAVLILHVTYTIMKDAVSPLIGEKPDDETMRRVHAITQAHAKRDINLHHVHMHRYGAHTELTFHIMMPPETSLADAHALATVIESAIADELAIETTIHMEPDSTPEKENASS